VADIVQTHWHTLAITDALAQLDSRAEGLTSTEAAQRFTEHGPNTIPAGRRRTVFEMFFSQFRDFMIMVLLAAALISGLVGEPVDTIAILVIVLLNAIIGAVHTIAILVIVLLNAIIGAVQEFRAEGAVAALREMAAPEARVLRDGKLTTVAAAALVPGDVVAVDAGNVVPADLRMHAAG